MTVFFWAVFSAVFATAGYRVAGRLAGDALGFVEKLAVGYFVSGFALYLAISAIGPFFLDWRTAAIIWVALGLSGLLSRRQIFSDGRHWHSEFCARWSDATLTGKSILAVTVMVAVSSLVQGLAPPNTFDSLHYHLPLAKFDVEVGRLEIQWLSSHIFNFFPQFMGHQSRLYLLVDPTGALAQMMHANLAVVAAIGAAGIARRAGLPVVCAWLAAMLFLINRGIIWQSASVETDTALAAAVALAVIAYLAWREQRSSSLMALFGFLAGCCVLIKYQGLAIGLVFGAIVLWDLVRRPGAVLAAISIGVIVAILTVSPHLARNVVLVGNPVFPLFTSLFDPEHVTFFAKQNLELGTGRSMLDLVLAPWMISVHPTRYFDGMVFGAPYLLALAPLAILIRPRLRHLDVLLLLVGGYFVVWFYFLSQQTRFLFPILPVLVVFCAAGAFGLFSQLSAKTLKVAAAVPIVLLLGIQGSFAGIYALLRLPPALGFVSAEQYLDETPTMDGAHFGICSFIESNLEEGQRYILLLSPKFYCPQASASHGDLNPDRKHWMFKEPRIPFSREQAVAGLLAGNFRYIVVTKKNAGWWRCKKGDCPDYRIRDLPIAADLQVALQDLVPLKESSRAAVFDGKQVSEAIRHRLPEPKARFPLDSAKPR